MLDAPTSSTVRCSYGRFPAGSHTQQSGVFHIPALYQPALRTERRVTFLKHRFAGEDFHLRYGLDAATSLPDWLGEIFNWLACEYESQIPVRDSIGRIPYSETVFHRDGLSPRKPHAALLMAWMENALRHGSASEALPRASSPVRGVDHLVLSSHDIDFYFVDRRSTLVRLLKNLAIAVGTYRSWSYLLDNLKMFKQAFTGHRVGDYLPALLEAVDERGLKSTFFVVSRRAHRRDPNYRLEQITTRLQDAAERGFSIGLHGSYRSVIEDSSLKQEARCLASAVRQTPLAGRQHWLRFRQHRDLFTQVASAGFLVDSTLGFPDMVGFRNGASFAFPPYDFEREASHQFLEVPLVLMDGSLQHAAARLRMDAAGLAEEVLGESRKAGWGGISVLWHNPVEALSVPAEINRVFWECAKNQKLHGEKWLAVDEFLAAALPRYQQAGLLQEIRVAEPERPLIATARM